MSSAERGNSLKESWPVKSALKVVAGLVLLGFSIKLIGGAIDANIEAVKASLGEKAS